MNFKAYQDKLGRLSMRLNFTVTLVFGLLLSNIILAGLVWFALIHQRIEITPFNGSSSYIKSNARVDSDYLSLMAENFIYSRLNVTPETVNREHHSLLRFVDSSSYNDILAQLKKEAALIKAQKISSSFVISGIKANPEELMVEINGQLRRFVGLREIEPSDERYFIHFKYHLGRLSIASFTHQKGEDHE